MHLKTCRLMFVVLAALLAAGCAPANIFFLAPNTAKSMGYATTEDGWQLAVYHYPPKGAPKDKPPVVLCHGFALNNYFWHITNQNNFPQWLADRGYDVYCIDLRGCGQSRYRKIYDEKYKGVDTAKRAKTPGEWWTVDDYANYDVPAVLKYVCEQTGKDQVTWIGHSMGGMILYAYRINHPDETMVAQFITVGSPIVMPQPANDILENMLKDEDFINAALDTKLMKTVMRSMALTSIVSPGPFDLLYYYRPNVTDYMIVSLWANSLENIQRGTSEQMMLMVKTGDFWNADSTLSYTEHLKQMELPMLFLAAKTDNMAPEFAMQRAFHSVSSEDKTYRLFAVVNSDSADYGHCDMITGKIARDEVYPVILKWLDAH